MAQDSEKSSGNQIQAVVNAFNIVESLAKLDGATVSELSDYEEIPKSTAHIYLKTLCDIGYVMRDGSDYQLSLRFLQHGGYVRHQLNIYQAAKSEIDDLSRRTGEVCDLGIEASGQRVLLYKSEGPKGVTQNPVTGNYTHMHMTALGKALLSTYSNTRVQQIIDNHGLPQSTRHTISSYEELIDDLEKTHERGYSIEDQERRDGVRAIGAPIRDREGGAVGAISISGPMSKLTNERIENNLREELKDTVNIIEIKHKNY
jgi:DNA-binding IclR family transcriptional regulator